MTLDQSPPARAFGISAIRKHEDLKRPSIQFQKLYCQWLRLDRKSRSGADSSIPSEVEAVALLEDGCRPPTNLRPGGQKVAEMPWGYEEPRVFGNSP
ncbi:hypothetical protein GW7_09442 [Heterocephalus glaber]|uniref:Uncharacterized protein n=1 Tax=Heterocephalus glaber TaxID=10181 RepID=G5B1S3_HETGA|nr:hypothetical protein GW7_09442 [Heterocephalus glaber]